jgi:hypothetical protein
LGGADGQLRDTHINVNLKDFFSAGGRQKEENAKNGHFLLVTKSNNPEAKFELSTYSKLSCRIFEIWDVKKNIISTAVH